MSAGAALVQQEGGATPDPQPAAPDRTLAPFGRRLATVTRNESIGAYRLLWAADPEAPAPRAGQFAMIAAAERWGGGAGERPYLPRAFSIALTSPAGETAFLLEDVGPGTHRLCELSEGDRLWVLGPLGRGFSDPPLHGRRTILVGGGIGIAALTLLVQAREPLSARGESPPQGTGGSPQPSTPGASGLPAGGERRCEALTVLAGFRSGAHAQGASLLGAASIATDDGSVGHAGRVTDLLHAELARGTDAVVRACGPPAMLEAVRSICERERVPAELALEASMACGFGACYGCVVPRRGGGYLRVCVDGPVVDAAELASVPGGGGQ